MCMNFFGQWTCTGLFFFSLILVSCWHYKFFACFAYCSTNSEQRGKKHTCCLLEDKNNGKFQNCHSNKWQSLKSCHVQYCWHDTSGKILFTTGTIRQIVTTRHTELLSGKCISLVDQGWHLSCWVIWVDKLSRPTDRVVKWKMHLISSLKQRSNISLAKEQACYTVCTHRSLSKDLT